MRKVIITAALVGSTSTKENNPAIPISPEEIVESALESYQAGASIVHVHVRDPESQKHTNRLGLYEEVCLQIRAKSDLIINLTTSYGASIIIDSNNTIKESDLLSAEKRVDHVLKLKPELCSLDIATFNFGPRIFTNFDDVVLKMADFISKSITKPEIEIFDMGQIEFAKKLIQKKLVKGIPHFQLCMGTSGGMAASPQNAVHAVNLLPQPCTWSMFGIGKNQFPMVAMSILLGGHVRVGLEDNLYLKKGIKSSGNGQLVGRAVDIIDKLDCEVATPAEAREILDLTDNLP